MTSALVVGASVRFVNTVALDTALGSVLGPTFAPGLRGVLTAGTMTIAYLAIAWRQGPEWLRRAARGEPVPSVGAAST